MFARICQTGAKCGQNGLFLVQARANDKREAKSFQVRVVEFREGGELFLAHAVQSGAGLFARRFSGERASHGGSTRQIGMSADQSEMLPPARERDCVAKRAMKVIQVRERSSCPGHFSNPGRVFEGRSDHANKFLAGEGIDLLQRKSGFVHRCCRFITPGMAAGKLIHQHYGKARVRLLKVFRHTDRHDIKEVDVSVQLEGDFAAAYIDADNRLVVPTDTMKNSVQVLAHEHLSAQLERFGVTVAQHFLKKYSQVNRASVTVAEPEWRRLNVDGRPHEHSFVSSNNGRRFTHVVASPKSVRVESGIEDLAVLKSTGSGFADFARDEFTTLAETGDRILATRLRAMWVFEQAPADYTQANESILAAMLKVFAVNYSPSVQATLYQMAEAALAVVPEISQVTLSMPNLHCLLANLKPFGRDNRNELFVPTEEPHGIIEATVARKNP